MNDTTLYHNDPTARTDKVYTVYIKETGQEVGCPGFELHTAFGRRGGTMQTGFKGSFGTIEAAQEAKRKLIAEKMAKGYKTGEDASPVEIPASANGTQKSESAGWLMPPMLLNEVDADTMQALLRDDGIVFKRLDAPYYELGTRYGSWGDNDGAYGEFKFDVATRTIKLSFNERYTESRLTETTL